MAQAVTTGLGWRPWLWAGAGALLLTPAVAMRFTDAVRWTPSDFVFAGALIGGGVLAFELLVRRGGAAYRLGAATALLAVFGLVWLNAAVGIIGGEDDPANLLFAGVIAVAVGGATVARLRAAAWRGRARRRRWRRRWSGAWRSAAGWVRGAPHGRAT